MGSELGAAAPARALPGNRTGPAAPASPAAVEEHPPASRLLPDGSPHRGVRFLVHAALLVQASRPLAIEVDGQVAAQVSPADRIELRPRPGAAHVVRLGHTTFYERARRKLRLTDSAEVPSWSAPAG